MAYATFRQNFSLCCDRAATVANGVGAKLKRLACRLSFEVQRRSEVDREIARLLAQSGGRLTDSLEREIMRKVLASEACPFPGPGRESL
jgi:hypothetical protein